MAMLCPHCNLPMTDAEARTGSCPVCDKPLPGITPAVKNPEPLPPAPFFSRTWLIGGCLGFLLLVSALWIATSEREKPDDVPRIADARKPEKEEPKTPKIEPLEPGKEEPKKPEPMKVEEKKEEPKPPEPMKVEEKKEEPKKPEPMIPMRQRQVALPFLANDAIKIDGDLGDWKDIKPVVLTPIERGRPTKPVRMKPPTQLAWFAHTQQGILVAVDVEDTSGELENVPKPDKKLWPFWDNDAIEVYIDTLNKHAGGRGEANTHQFFAFPFGTPNDGGMSGYESKMLGTGKAIQSSLVSFPSEGPNSMRRAGKKTPLGWNMELLIPKTALRGPLPKAGDSLGFELQIDTGTNLFYFWANDDPLTHVSMHPSAWGEVSLNGTDALLEAIDAAIKATKSFVPGQPLKVRVSDADRNLDPAKKDTVSVTVRSRSEDVKTLVLEETAPDSSIFVGSLATRIATGVIVADVFEVVSGENIAIEYVDAGRANGERNGKVRASVLAGP